MLSLKETINKILNWIKDTDEVQTLTPTWNTGTAGSATVRKWGKVVELRISNPTQLAVNSNIVFTLPAGWRPISRQYMMIIRPTGSISLGGIELSLRVTVQTNGEVEIYNYRSSAINANTNAHGTITYIVN